MALLSNGRQQRTEGGEESLPRADLEIGKDLSRRDPSPGHKFSKKKFYTIAVSHHVVEKCQQFLSRRLKTEINFETVLDDLHLVLC